MFKHIGIITNKAVSELDSVLRPLVDFLLQRGHELTLPGFCTELATRTGVHVSRDNTSFKRCDLAIAIGGDGTMLMASHLLHPVDVPLLGINLGRIGFLADIPAETITDELGPILEGKYVEDERFLIEGTVYKHNHLTHTTLALNDLVIQKWNTARLMELDTYVDKRFVHTHRSDGMIVSTPTGSTAYSLSGGGPILHPQLNALLLVPICPHTLSNRPIMVHGDSTIEVALGAGKGQAWLSADGEPSEAVSSGDRVCVTKKGGIRLIHPTHYDPFRILREKMHWGR